MKYIHNGANSAIVEAVKVKDQGDEAIQDNTHLCDRGGRRGNARESTAVCVRETVLQRDPLQDEATENETTILDILLKK